MGSGRRTLARLVVVAAVGPASAGVLEAQSPQFRGTPEHTGVAPTEGPARFGGVAWRFETGGTVRSSAALHDGVLYVGSSDGVLYALSEADGTPVWRYEAGAPIPSSPAVHDGLVLVVDRSGTLHAVSRADGTRRWTTSAGRELALPWGHEGWDYFVGSVAVADGVAYWGAGDGVVRAVDPSTGEVFWSFPTGGRVRSTPAVANGMLVVGSGDGVVYALDAATGAERWRFATAGTRLESADFDFDRRQITASPVIADEVVYLGSRDATLYALDARTGTPVWTVEEESAWVIGTAAVAGERVLSTRSSSGNIRAVRRSDGTELWVTGAGAVVYSSPVVAGDLMYVGEGDGDFAAYDVATGERRWSYRTGGGVWASPVVHEGRAYVGSDDGFVYAFQGAEGPGVRRAVYFDEALAPGAAFGSRPEHRVVRDHFSGRGYELLDGEGLRAFLAEEAVSGRPSVVVMGMDRTPDDADIRPYLRGGGKVVWIGYPPGFLVRDEEGAIAGTDREAAERLLQVGLDAFDGDMYGSAPTAEGRAWGLRDRWVGVAVARPGDVTTTLARDEIGRAAAWVKSYGGRDGSGFVYLFPTSLTSLLPEIQRIAEYGVVGD